MTDITAWLDWFIGCFERALEHASTDIDGVIRRSQFWTRHADAVFNARQVNVLTRLLDGLEGKMTTSKWARMSRCSQDSAYRDIAQLVDRGVLVKLPGGGRSTGYALADF